LAAIAAKSLAVTVMPAAFSRATNSPASTAESGAPGVSAGSAASVGSGVSVASGDSLGFADVSTASTGGRARGWLLAAELPEAALAANTVPATSNDPSRAIAPRPSIVHD
jgi:hypothetical protein